MRAFLAGGCGFVGSAVARALIARGDEALAVDNQTAPAPAGATAELARSGRFAAVKADVSDRVMMTALVREYEPDCIIHTVSPKPGLSDAEHSIARRTALVGVLLASTSYRCSPQGAVKDNFRVVVAASDAAYPPLAPTDAPHTEMSGYDPATLEGASEAGVLLMARAWGRSRSLPVIVAHAGRLYGRWQSQNALTPRVVREALSGDDIFLSDAETVRDWLHVDDFARGLIAAGERGRPGARYLFGEYAERSVLDVARAVCTLLDAKRPRPDGDYAHGIHIDEDLLDVGVRYGLDPSLAEQELKWAPEKSLHLGLADAVDWALSQIDPLTPAAPRAAE